ncbi:MAG: type III-B CRISPR module RAMP protein Cmr6 [Acidobacteriota bacterium]|nr:type III-B CRISPR module RAMP protein Cmr6 [Acidobacteriota bacterium]
MTARGTTRLVAPADWKDRPLIDIVKGEPTDRRYQPIERPEIPEALLCSPNIGLLWHRYLPAHDLKEISGAQRAESPAGVDFSEIWRQAEGVNPSGNWKKSLSSAAKTWAGLGCLRWFAAVAAKAQPSSGGLFSILQQRREQHLAQGASITVRVQALRRVAVGLGLPAGFENSGVALEHTYGFPVLPGPSLKGLLAHFLEEEWEPDAGERLPASAPDALALRHCLLGGGGTGGVEGAIAFFDGWPLEMEDGWFEPDVVNPHHGDYYDGGGRKVASDSEEPVPSFFIALRAGIRFVVPLGLTAVARELEQYQAEELLGFTKQMLLAALTTWGVGARTGSGYGLFREDKS